MGAGKTTVGELLAQELGYKFFDTDALIAQIAGKSIPDIFAMDGEAAFRSIESKVLGEISSYTRLVIATGGGIVLAQQNWSYLHQGLVVWLDVPIPLLVDRLQSDSQSDPFGNRPEQRPLLQTSNLEQRLTEILSQRETMYAQADLKISINDLQTPEAVKSQILELIPTVLRQDKQATLN